jgi:hypothetical protein
VIALVPNRSGRVQGAVERGKRARAVGKLGLDDVVVVQVGQGNADERDAGRPG